METQSTNPQKASEAWSTKSKKDLLFGFIIVIAGIGTEPFFGSLSNYAMVISLLFVFIGAYIALLGYLER